MKHFNTLNRLNLAHKITQDYYQKQEQHPMHHQQIGVHNHRGKFAHGKKSSYSSGESEVKTLSNMYILIQNFSL